MKFSRRMRDLFVLVLYYRKQRERREIDGDTDNPVPPEPQNNLLTESNNEILTESGFAIGV